MHCEWQTNLPAFIFQTALSKLVVVPRPRYFGKVFTIISAHMTITALWALIAYWIVRTLTHTKFIFLAIVVNGTLVSVRFLVVMFSVCLLMRLQVDTAIAPTATQRNSINSIGMASLRISNVLRNHPRVSFQVLKLRTSTNHRSAFYLIVLGYTHQPIITTHFC